MAALICAILAVTIPASIAYAVGTVNSAVSDTKAPYSYQLKLISNHDAETLQFELCVSPSVSGEPVLGGGSFSLRFPKRMGGANVVFTPNSDETNGHIDINSMVPPERLTNPAEGVIKKDGYIAFSWTRSQNIKDWKFDSERGWHLFIGTFTFSNVKAAPFKTDIGQMNFLKMAEAIPLELPESERGDPATDAFNITVWNAQTQQYRGYYRSSDPSDPAVKKTDIGLDWTPPKAWKNAFTVLSYNPKNSITVTLCDDTGTAIADTISTQTWAPGTTTADSAELYSATDANANLGIGAYYAAVDFEDFKNGTAPVSAVKDKKYILRMEKPGHLTKELLITATDTNFANCTGLPEDGEAVYLPAGDVNPIKSGENVIFGDGRIDMADRAALMRFLGGSATTDPVMARVIDPGKLMYYADIDGDGRVTKADLSILMSPENFRKIQVKEGTA